MARHKIALMGTPIVSEEYAAEAAITPGHLLEVTSTGTVKKQSDDAANVAPMFALERDELGKDIDDAYASGDIVKAGTFKPGERVYAFLASGQNVAIGAYLTSTATGLLTATGVAAGIRLAKALEAVNSVADTTRIRVEIV